MSFAEEISLRADDKASSVVAGLSGQLRGLLGSLSALAGMVGAGFGFGALVKQGLDFNRSIEDTRGGLAGVLLLTREYTGVNGELLSGQRAVTAAMGEADVIQEKLKKDALGTAASYVELVQAFQSSIGPATSAGVKNLDNVREITVMATQAMSALGIPTAQAAQELRGLFSGDMGPDNRLNQILRVTKEDLAKVHGNADATAKLFKDRLAPAASAAAMQTGTLTVRLSNLGDIVDQTMGEATKGLFRDISQLIADVTSGVGEAAGAFSDVGTTVRESFAVVKETISDVAGVVRQDLSNAGITGREVLQSLAILFVGFVESVGTGMKAVAQYVTAPVETLWGVWKTLVFGIASLFSEMLLKLSDAPLVGKFFKGWSMGMDDLVVSMTTVDQRFASFEQKATSSFGSGGPFEHAKKLLESFSEAAAAAGSKVDDLGSRAKKTAEDVQSAARAMAAKFKAEVVPVFSGFWSDYLLKPLKIGWTSAELIVGKSTDRMLETVSEWRERIRKEIDGLFEYSPDSAEAGVRAGWLSVIASLPKTAESAAAAVQGVWQSMARTFDDAFFSVISGRLDSLGDVFRGFASNLQGIFSKLVTDMVQRWLSGQQTIAEGWAQLNKAMQTSSGNLSVEGGLMAAGTGYGIGGMVGQGTQANQIGGAVGGVVGAIIGSIIPVIGTALGALIGSVLGGLIGELFNKNTERKFTGSIGGMVGATRYDLVPLYAPETRGGPRGIDDGTSPGEPIGWETRASLESPRTAFDRAGQKVFEKQTATFADLFRLGAKDQAEELIAAYQTSLKEMLGGAWVTIAAGSQEDIEKDAQRVINELLPKIGLSAAFGQTGYLPNGNKDAAGGMAGISWGMPGFDEAGNWTGAKQLFDPNAPIPKMLAGLGFTDKKIGELAALISTDDPEKLLAYITGIVGVVVGLRDLGAEMGKTFDELVTGWKTESAAGPAAALGKTAQDLAGQFDALSLYSGDEQLKKGQEAQAAASQFWESVKSYLQQLQALSEKLSAGLQGMREKMRAFLNPESESAAMTSGWGVVDATWGKLYSAKSGTDVESAANEAAAAIEKIFSILAERITRGKALLERLGDIGDRLSRLSGDVAFDQLEKENPLRAWGQTLAEIQTKVSDAAKLTGLDQINAIEAVASSAEDMLGKLKSFLSEIASTASSITKSIDAQKWELGVGELDNAGQASAITDRIKLLQEQLKIATSPAEVQAITSEIQSLTSRYVGTFDKDDPKRAEAIAWAQEQLDRLKGLATEALDAMRTQAEAQAAELEGILKTATTNIASNVDDAATQIGNLSFALSELDRVTREVLTGLGQTALDALEPLRIAMNGAAGIFTGAVETASLSLTTETGLEGSTKRVTSALNDGEAAIRRFIKALDSFPGASQTSSSASSSSRSTSTNRASTTQIVSTIRRMSGALTPRVG